MEEGISDLNISADEEASVSWGSPMENDEVSKQEQSSEKIRMYELEG